MPLTTFAMEGVALVVVGSFSPLQMNPQALASQGFINPEDLEKITQTIVTDEIVQFRLPWANFACTTDRLEINTSDQPQVQVLDLALNILQANTTIQCLSAGMNWFVHTGPVDEERKKNLDHLTVSQWKFLKNNRSKAQFRSLEWFIENASLFEGRRINLKMQPSVLSSSGIYFVINDHLEVPEESRTNTSYLFDKLQDRWDNSKREAYNIINEVWDSL